MAKRILLVEDEADLRLALSVRLRAAGFACDTASHGKEGLERVAVATPDLIIVDLLMPVMDGYEMVRRLKADSKTASIPVMVVTALHEHSRDSQSLEIQGLKLLEKPFDFHELLAMIRAIVTPPPASSAAGRSAPADWPEGPARGGGLTPPTPGDRPHG